MAREMTPDELRTAKKTARPVNAYDYRNDDDENDYVNAALFELPDKRTFRLISASGMNSMYAGAGDFGEWLEPDEIARWTAF